MQIAYHFGAHCTDEDRLLKCLFKNQGALADRGIIVTGPQRYRTQLRKAVDELRGMPASSAKQAELLRDIDIPEGTERLIFSHSAFFSSAGGAMGLGRFYPKAGELAQGYARLVPEHECDFFFAIRDPASFIPALFHQSKEEDFPRFLMGFEPVHMRWSETIGRIRRATPDTPLTVWCNEDSPIIWHDILNRLAGIDANLTLRRSYDFPTSLLTQEGVAALSRVLKSSAPRTAQARRELLRETLEEFGAQNALEEEIALPNWTQDLMDTLSKIYDEDMQRIAEMDGVTLLTQ